MSRERWPFLHGASFASSPKCDILYNVLYSMGIYPNIETFPLRHTNRFTDLNEAINHFASKCIAVTGEQKEVLGRYLEEHAGLEEGDIVVPGHSTRVKIWWEKKDS